MKPTKPASKSHLFTAFLLFLLSVQCASAFYDPSLQRWMNRDPINDVGVTRAGSQNLITDKMPRREAGRSTHLFEFVHNSPTREIDFFGLFGGWGSSGGLGVPGSDATSLLNRSPTCIGEIAAAVKMLLGNAGFEGYPTANDDDSLQHCTTSCRIARACGKSIAALLGQLKETNDLLHGGSAHESDKDLEDNAFGRSGAGCLNKSCEDYCSQNRDKYR